MIQFDLPKQHSSIIKVIGIGGGGGNAVNHMFNMGMEGVDFVICNTDAQALHASQVPNKIQLGPHLTQGLGAGMNPTIGRQATEESLDEIRRLLEVNTKMVFITAGMGGGTGTGGAPVVARMCREMGILTVGIVTVPFSYEMKKRMQQAEEGIAEMKQYVDTLLVISNDKLRHQFGTLTMKAAFSTADNVLATAARCITDVISNRGHINVDFADVCTVMRNGGMAILGSARMEGDDRALRAIEQAINSPLLNDNDIHGAKWILININSAEGEHEFTVDEVETIQQYIQAHAGSDYDLFMGLGYDNALGAQIGITVIATGFQGSAGDDMETAVATRTENTPREEARIILELGRSQPAAVPVPDPVATPAPQPEPTLVINRLERTDSPRLEPLYPASPAAAADPIPETGSNAPVSVPLSRQADASNPLQPATPPQHHENQGAPPTLHILPPQGDFFAKPARIYVDREGPVAGPDTEPQNNPHQESRPVFDPNAEMHLVIRENPAADGPDHPSAALDSASIEEPALQDELEEQKRIKAIRELKLRNLSYRNYNVSDPNNEYEQIPAYIRRGSPERTAQPPSAPEQLFSNITVNADPERDKGYLSSLNSFLDGKKPD